MTLWYQRERGQGSGLVAVQAVLFSVAAALAAGVSETGYAWAQTEPSQQNDPAVASPPPAVGRVSALPLPRFVSLRTEPVNLRTGPGTRYPVSWVYQRRDLPVEVTDEFDTWRRIRDIDGTEGWVHQSMLSGQRTGLMLGGVSPLYKGSTPASAVIARLEPGVVIEVDRCPPQTEFCLVKAGVLSGWLRRGLFWGLYDGELID